MQIFCIMTTIFKMAAKIYVNIKLLQTGFFSFEYIPKHARRVLMELFKCFQNLSFNWIVQDNVICNADKSI